MLLPTAEGGRVTVDALFFDQGFHKRVPSAAQERKHIQAKTDAQIQHDRATGTQATPKSFQQLKNMNMMGWHGDEKQRTIRK